MWKGNNPVKHRVEGSSRGGKGKLGKGVGREFGEVRRMFIGEKKFLQN